MKKITLKKLTIENFKGIEKMTLDFNDDFNEISGRNGAGKTTIADAFFFLLFGKDSLGISEFDITPLKPDGTPTHHLNTRIEGCFKDGDVDYVFERIYKEKWTKGRDKIEKELTGHTTKYKINSQVVKKTEYNKRIDNLFNITLFKLLSDPLYFSEKIPMEKRREIIMQALGTEVSNEDVVESNPDLKGVLALCKDRSVSDVKKSFMSEKLDAEKELSDITTRIDENKKALVNDDVDLNEKQIRTNNIVYKNEIKKLNERLAASDYETETKKQILDRKRELEDLQTKKHEIELDHLKKKRAAELETDKKTSELNRKSQAIKHKIDKETDQKSNMKDRISDLKKSLKDRIDKRADFLKKWDEWAGKVPEVKDRCSLCGQPFSDDTVRHSKEEFNKLKASTLEDINREGKENTARIDTLKIEMGELTTALKISDEKISTLESDLLTTKQQILRIKNESALNDDMSDLEPVIKEISIKKNEIEELKDLDKDKDEKIKAQKKNIELSISEYERKIEDGIKLIERIDGRKDTEKRITDLKNEHKTVSEQINMLLNNITLVESFISTKARMLEDIINKKIKYANIRLFDIQINKGIKEICEIEVDGVPFNSLNNAARINAGISVIEAISEYYQFYPPMWIDGAESILDIKRTPAQMFVLRVKDDDLNF